MESKTTLTMKRRGCGANVAAGYACMGGKMGGRGASSGVSDKGLKYGTELSLLALDGNMMFVRYNFSKSAKVPLETMSSRHNRVYVAINSAGKISAIAFYNKEGKLRRQIDFGHERPILDVFNDLRFFAPV